ncbi:MAG: DUF72 domain-containing protein [Syntrophobacterales bacterium]
MSNDLTGDIEKFIFHHLHPQVRLGTASDRYAGWQGQIYTPDRYARSIRQRSKEVGGQTLTEAVLPVESVAEYFEHFSVLELDFTFYRFLKDQQGKPTQNFQTLRAYSKHLQQGDALILKVPQAITAPKLRRRGQYEDNPTYLNPGVFTRQFYEPASELLGPVLTGFIFEQEYLTKQDRPPVTEMATALDKFFQEIPRDNRYHLELRTELYLREPVFEVLERHGVGQVLSHWTWLPPLRKQLIKAGGRFFNAGKQCVIRLLTPLGMRYEDSYVQAYPFDKLVEAMLRPEMIQETVDLMSQAINQGVQANVIINNRAGGNAPLIAQRIARKFLERVAPAPKPKRQLSFWEP